ncbi:MAG: 3-isopropylmalate dehydrogenase [Nitrospinota bacterium]|nr:3-isopropylmalate dehydrogenase [Nitrospinota bacterium]
MPLIAICGGDGIGPEVTTEAVKVLKAVDEKYKFGFKFVDAPVGGSAYDKFGTPLPPESLETAKKADAVFLGAVGGPKWESLDYSVRPERALLGLRSELDLFANLRPAKLFAPLVDASTLKREVVEGVDMLVVRELCGGIYFGKPRGVEDFEGGKRGINTLVYTTPEIVRIARVAFEAARKRRGKVCSVDKANVLECTELWRNVVIEVHKDYKDVELSHMYVDNATMQLIRNPKQFDVIVTTNMFGDILSDAAAMLTGSIGMLPSASLSGKKGMYEPVHGSAPDIAGKGIANPLAAILSAGMMLTYSFDKPEAEAEIEKAVASALDEGYRCADIFSGGTKKISTAEMGDLIVKKLKGN